MLPDGWSEAKLGQIAQILTGGTPNRSTEEYWGGEIPWMSSGEINQRFVKSVAEHITAAGLKNSNARLLPIGTVLIALNGQGKTRGKVALLEIETTCNQSLAGIVPNAERLFGKYAFHLLDSKYQAIREITGDDARNGLNLSILRDIDCLLPPLFEQKQIAEILGGVDAAIEATKAVIDQTKTVKQGLLQTLLTRGIGHTKFKVSPLGEMPDDWSERKLSDVCRFLNGRAYNKDELLDKGKYTVLRVGNFFTNENWYYSDLELEENKYCDNGDLLYAWSASFAPKIWTGGKVIYHYHIWKLVPDERLIDKLYLYYFLEWDVENIKSSVGNGSTMIHITKGAIEQRPFNLPPIPEQLRIAEVMSSVDAVIQRNVAKLSALQTLKKGLMDDLLTGKVRVGVGQVAEAQASNVVPFALTAPVDAVRKHAVLSAEITAQLYHLNTFGATKREKLTDLVVRHVGLDETTDRQAARHAAGSYDPKARREIDDIFERENWFKIQRSPSAVKFVKGTAFGGHKAEFDDQFGSVKLQIQKVINLLRDYDTRHCEIIDTLYTAWNDFLIEGKSPSDEEIITEVLTNWHDSKRQIPRQDWRDGMAWMRERDFVPSGRGRSTKAPNFL